MFDIWQEIFSTIRKNKLRTFLTGFSMAWGIFMLILLLGAGNGLKNGVSVSFGNAAKNSVYIWPGQTSMPYKGLQKGRLIKFDETEKGYLKREFPFISYFSASIIHWNPVISYGKEYGNNTVRGVEPDFAEIDNVVVEAGNGRFINEVDMQQARKVIVIHKKTAKGLFREEAALGKYLVVDGVAYQVIGIYEGEDRDQLPDVYVPLSTAQRIYNPAEGYRNINFMVEGLSTTEENEAFDTELRAKLGQKHTFDIQDRQAVWVWNKLKNYMQTMGIFKGINLFVWIIGIGTLIAGIVGISNIMLITVKERTKEFGIRKALGATPFSILKLIILEALLITGFFGYIGMVAGVGLTELVNNVMAGAGSTEEMSIFRNPTVDLPIVISATVVLIVAGILAGYFPARKAVHIKPIEALRYE